MRGKQWLHVVHEAFAASQIKWEAAARFGTVVSKEDNPCGTCTTHGCCKQLALCAFFEAVLIAEYLSTFDRNVGVRLIEQGQAQHRLATEADCANPDLYGEKISGPWFDRNEFCALYDTETKRCLIYEYRPMACASYFVKNDPSQCEPPTGTRVAVADNTKPLIQMLLIDDVFTKTIGIKDGIPPSPIGLQVLRVLNFATKIRKGGDSEKC